MQVTRPNNGINYAAVLATHSLLAGDFSLSSHLSFVLKSRDVTAIGRPASTLAIPRRMLAHAALHVCKMEVKDLTWHSREKRAPYPSHKCSL